VRIFKELCSLIDEAGMYDTQSVAVLVLPLYETSFQYLEGHVIRIFFHSLLSLHAYLISSGSMRGEWVTVVGIPWSICFTRLSLRKCMSLCLT